MKNEEFEIQELKQEISKLKGVLFLVIRTLEELNQRDISNQIQNLYDSMK